MELGFVAGTHMMLVQLGCSLVLALALAQDPAHPALAGQSCV